MNITPEIMRSDGKIDSNLRRSLLHSIPLFRGVGSEDIMDLMTNCTRIELCRGEVLLSPERENRCVYIVLTGRLTVRLASVDAPSIAEILPGSCVGEMSLIEQKDASAYVTAAQDSQLMVINRNSFLELVDRSHVFAKNLLVALSERIRLDNQIILSRLGNLQRIERNAVTDALTGLGNRHWMRDMFERELIRGKHNHTPICLMMIDVDCFKRFNDRHGHVAGDRVLISVAKAIRNYLRPTDLVARFGGDEFTALLPDIELDQAEQTAHRLLSQVSQHSPANISAPITVSIGVTRAAADDDLDALVHRADAAMYRSKAAGRNSVSVVMP